MKINQKSTFWLFLIDEDPPPLPDEAGVGAEAGTGCMGWEYTSCGLNL